MYVDNCVNSKLTLHKEFYDNIYATYWSEEHLHAECVSVKPTDFTISHYCKICKSYRCFKAYFVPFLLMKYKYL